MVGRHWYRERKEEIAVAIKRRESRRKEREKTGIEKGKGGRKFKRGTRRGRER